MALTWGVFFLTLVGAMTIQASPDLRPQTSTLKQSINKAEKEDDLPLIRDPQAFIYQSSLKFSTGWLSGRYRSEEDQNLNFFGFGFDLHYRHGMNLSYSLDLISDSSAILNITHHWVINPESHHRLYLGLGVGSILVANELFATVLNSHNFMALIALGIHTLIYENQGLFAETTLSSHWNGPLPSLRIGYNFSW